MKSLSIYATLACATMAAAYPGKDKKAGEQQAAAANGSSIADAGAAAAIAAAQQAQGQNNNNQNNNQNNEQNLQNLQNLQNSNLNLGSVSSGQALLQQIQLEQSQLCGFNNVANEIAQTVLIQGLQQQELASIVPLLAGSNGLGFSNIVNGGYANNGLLDLNSLSAIQGAVLDQNLGLQVVAVQQAGLGNIGIAPIVQGLAVSSGFPIIQNGQLVQVVSLDQAIAQQLELQQLLTPVLVNGQLQQIFAVDQNVLAAAGGLLGGLPLVSGVNVAAIPFNVASSSVWNQGINNNQNLGLLGAGVANVLPLSVGTPFFLQSSSFFNQGGVSSLSAFTPSNLVSNTGSVAFLFADPSVGAIDFNSLNQLSIANVLSLGSSVAPGQSSLASGFFKN